MLYSQSTSPRHSGGWQTPTTENRFAQASPGGKSYTDTNGVRRMNGFTSNDNPWAAAKAKSDQVRGYPSFSTRNEGFFLRSKRRITQTLPRFRIDGEDWRSTEKLGRGQWQPGGRRNWSSLRTLVGNVLRRFKIVFILLMIIVVVTGVASQSGKVDQWKHDQEG